MRMQSIRKPSLIDRGWPLDAGCLLHALLTFLRIDDAQIVDDLEGTVDGLRNVHVHANMMLTGHHFSTATRPFSDLRMVQRSDDSILLQGACFLDRSLPEPQASVQA